MSKMNVEEVIENLENIKEYCHYDYEIESIEAAISILMKQLPQKKVYINQIGYYCPICNTYIENVNATVCPDCHQNLKA